jgi:HD-GYP domain-containing protein (c-di-GMP phosphodiesterase class II)
MKPIEFLDKASEIPYYHHEWVNGAGYPNGVKGDEIPLSSRIFSIIDVYDALTSDRPYREAWTHEVAMAYIIDLSDKQFDSKLVNAFVTFIEQYRKGL